MDNAAAEAGRRNAGTSVSPVAPAQPRGSFWAWSYYRPGRHRADSSTYRVVPAVVTDNYRSDEEAQAVAIGYQDDVIPALVEGAACDGEEAPPWRQATTKRGVLCTVVLVTLGIFLASCPVARMHLSFPPRLLLLTLTASLVALPCPRYSTIMSRPALAPRLLVAYAGFYLFVYAALGASEEVHFEARWQSLAWYDNAAGSRPGYLTRLVFLALGFIVQKRAGMYTTRRVLLTYFLCYLWAYADTITTIVDLARGRRRW